MLFLFDKIKVCDFNLLNLHIKINLILLFDSLYLVVNCTVPIILILGGILLLFLRIPDIPALSSYKTARKAMACAYLIFGISCGAEILINNNQDPNMIAVAMVSLIVASAQSCLFTYALVVLIDIKYFTKQKLRLQIFLISIFSLISVVSLVSNDTLFMQIIFYSFLAFYIYQLIYYTRMFISRYSRYKRDAGNFFSEDEGRRLNWVVIAFFSALTIGIVVLVLILDTTPIFSLFVTTLTGLFYSFFLIKYLNYPQTFDILGNFISTPSEEEQVETFLSDSEKLADQLAKWEFHKEYHNSQITIISLANKFGTNRTYLSSHINKHKKQNFNAWINMLRIEDAKTLLIEDVDISISELAQRLGYNDHSTFSRQFKKLTGSSPLEWRKINSVCP